LDKGGLHASCHARSGHRAARRARPARPLLRGRHAEPAGADVQHPKRRPARRQESRKAKTKIAKKQKRSDADFLKGYRQAHALIYQQHDYAGGIGALRALGRDEHADVANLIGFGSRKLGRYDDAKTWYEKALAADPNHARTWSYYGMWHAEQGNVLKAQDHLEKVRLLCGVDCKDYRELKGVMDGTSTY
jgi:tetratricopeptide (TPR) repeat protein